MSKPAHKQDDPAHAPGQIVNRPEQTLGDYLARKNWHDAFDKVAEEKGLKKKKLTYKEWADAMVAKYGFVNWQCAECWKAAQENV